MSIVCAAIKNGRIAISGDSLTSYGSLTASSSHVANCNKLYRVNDSVVGLVGWCAISTLLEHLMLQEKDLFHFGNRMQILDTMLEVHQRMKRNYFLDSRDDHDQPVESTQLQALIVNASGLYEVSRYRSVTEYKTFWAIGSGRRYALGAMHAAYAGRKSARSVAEAGVMAASEFDDGCALPLTTKVISARN